MALTALVINVAPFAGVPLQIPRVVATTAFASATGTQGYAITQPDDTFKVAKFLEVGADVDVWWSDQDAGAVTGMRKIPAGSTHRLQTMPGATINYFIRCSTNANVVVTVEA